MIASKLETQKIHLCLIGIKCMHLGFYTKYLKNLKDKDKGNYRSSCHFYHCHCFQEKNTIQILL